MQQNWDTFHSGANIDNLDLIFFVCVYVEIQLAAFAIQEAFAAAANAAIGKEIVWCDASAELDSIFYSIFSWLEVVVMPLQIAVSYDLPMLLMNLFKDIIPLGTYVKA